MGTYKEQGHETRLRVYDGAMVFAILAFAFLIFYNFITFDQIDEFIDIVFRLVTILSTLGIGVPAFLARKNVAPPNQPNNFDAVN